MQYIDSIQNKRVKQWKKLLTKKERDLMKYFLVEGSHLVEEALKAAVVEAVIMAESFTIPINWNLDRTNIYIVSHEIIQMLSDTETPQGIFALCHQRQNLFQLDQFIRLLLVDCVQDPGNIGTMIRTADAAGVDAVVLGDGCADLYNAKTIRATQGSLFHLPVYKRNLLEFVLELKAAGFVIFGTSLKNAKPYTEVIRSKELSQNTAMSKSALIVGNEGSGVSQDLLMHTDENLYIPIFGKTESLNVAVATGILLYAMTNETNVNNNNEN